MPQLLLLVSIVILVCILGNKVSSRLGIPMLLAFILLGMLFGSDGIIKISFDNFSFAGDICSAALIFIMFYGGFGTNWRVAKPVAPQAILLSTAGVVLTAGCTGLFCRWCLGLGWVESFLIGSVVSSTDAASVFSVLRSRKLNLKYHTASLLEVESGSNDPFSYMLTVICLSLMGGSLTAATFFRLLLSQIVFGLGFGLAIAVASLWFLRRFRFGTSGFDAIFVLSIALLSYAAPTAVGGNGYLSTYVVGILLGNQDLRNKPALVHFFDGLTGLMQMLIFFLLGLLSFPSKMPAVIGPALAIAAFLTFVARPLSVAALLTPFRCSWRQQALIAWSGLRGAASIVFAILATVHPSSMESDVFHIVFCIVLFSILVQGSLIPAAARRLQMIDEHANVLKTFNDYTEEIPVQFIRFAIPSEHPWAGKTLQEILLPPDTLVVLLQRDDGKIVPSGDTCLMPGDILVLSAKAAGTYDGVCLTELLVEQGHPWIGKTVARLPVGHGKLIVMIRRRDRVVIPSGTTAIQEGDLLVINQPS